MSDERVWWPVSAAWSTGEDDTGVRHAVRTVDGAGNGPLVGACGVRWLRPVAYPLRVPSREGVAVYEWPPFAFQRCKACHTATGSPRVSKDSAWRDQT